MSAGAGAGAVSATMLREQLTAEARHLLAPDEVLQVVVLAQTMPHLALISPLLSHLLNARRVVLVTDRRILVCRTGRPGSSSLGEVLRELPRATIIGPRGFSGKTRTLGKGLYIDRQFHDDVAMADSMATSRPAMPPDRPRIEPAPAGEVGAPAATTAAGEPAPAGASAV
ncbi:MAG TPA: hypothetical protein VMD59_17180, partial [Acidimicrobiales bacterium]|nr:hypothetical protein [Acidimicrobiales bacterium]